eukprot:NODE_12_length_45166_cov_0.552511.p21 type:complete len:127 gc:universal NODE_12_length_45166_cov_0.552511:43253-43633(+)
MDTLPPLNRRRIWCQDTLETCRSVCNPTTDITCNEGTLNYTCPCDISKQPKSIDIYACGYQVDVCKSNCSKNDTVCINYCESKRCLPQVVITQKPGNGKTPGIEMDASANTLSLILVIMVVLQVNF